MTDTTREYSLKVYVPGKGWQIADMPKSAVTRNDYVRMADFLRAYGVQATVHETITTVKTYLLYQNWPEDDL